MNIRFSCSVVSDSLRSHGPQHTRLPCPSPIPGCGSNSCLSSQWCHPYISSSVIPFFSCLQSFPTSGSFPMNQFFTSCDQSYWSFSFSISPSNEYSGLISFRDWLAWSPCSPRDSQESFPKHSLKAQFFSTQLSLWSNSHIHTWQLETIALTRWTFVSKVMSLLFNMLSRFLIAFFPKEQASFTI